MEEGNPDDLPLGPIIVDAEKMHWRLATRNDPLTRDHPLKAVALILLQACIEIEQGQARRQKSQGGFEDSLLFLLAMMGGLGWGVALCYVVVMASIE
jgi:hypothetical protein